LTNLKDALTGNPSAGLGNKCAGVNHGDRIARGYITVDAVNNCTIRFPGDVGYFGAGGTGDVTNQNVLWGDVMYINKAVDKAFGQPLLHILASATDPSTSTSGRYTFYGRYDNFTAVDNRQPLSTTFAARFINASSSEGARYFSGGTAMIVWRDSKVAQVRLPARRLWAAPLRGMGLARRGSPSSTSRSSRSFQKCARSHPARRRRRLPLFRRRLNESRSARARFRRPSMPAGCTWI
jgi:hypothetical protein